MTTSDETVATTVAVRTDVAALAAGLVTVAAWGSAFVGIRAAGETLSPGPLALGRLIVSLAVLGSVAAIRREPLPGRRDLLWIAAFGVLWLAVYSVALNEAERRVDAGTAAMLVNTGPILIAILAGIFLREGFPPGLFAGCAVAFCGVVVIGLATAESGARSGLGVVLCIVAALAYSVAVVVQKPVLARVSSFQVTWLGRRRSDRRLPAVRAGARNRGRQGRCVDDRLDDLPRCRADRPRLRDLGVRPSANERRPHGVDHVPGPARGHPARLGGAGRDAAVARGGRRGAVPRRGRACAAAANATRPPLDD